LFRGVLFVFVQNTFLKSFDFIVFFAEEKYRFSVVFISKPEVSLPVFQAKNRRYDLLKKHSVFRYTMVTARATPQTERSPKLETVP
jgi:hypothetical protein